MTKTLSILIATIKGRFKCDESEAYRIHNVALKLKSDYADADNETGNFVLNAAQMIEALSHKVAVLENEIQGIKNLNQFNS